MSTVHTLGMTTAQLANFARQSTPEACAATIELLGNKIDSMFNIMAQAGVAPADRSMLEHQLAVILAACARMKTGLKQLQTALNDLREAQAFLQTCRNNPAEALETGAMRDAHDWVANAQAGLQTAATAALRSLGAE